MKAVRFQNTGEPADVLHVEELEVPRPKPGEVLVRMLASPVNPSDLMFVRGRYTTAPNCPATPGFEGVGVVESSGGGLRGRLFAGRRVAVLNRRGGNWAEYAVVPSSQIIPLSSSLSLEQAATFFVNPATAWVMTQEVLQVPRGAWLLQTAAGSELGRMIIRLGRHCGFRTFNVVRRQSVANELLGLGADHVHVMDESPDSSTALSASIREVISPDGVRFAIDSVGGATGSAVVNTLANNGRLLAFGTLSNQPLLFSPRVLMTTGSSVEGFWLGHFMDQKGLIFKLRLVRQLTRLIRNGVFASRIAAHRSLSEISNAVRDAGRDGSCGKVLLTLGKPQ